MTLGGFSFLFFLLLFLSTIAAARTVSVEAIPMAAGVTGKVPHSMKRMDVVTKTYWTKLENGTTDFMRSMLLASFY